MLKKINIFFQCKILKVHNWTSAAAEGIDPTPEQLRIGSAGFWEYAKMYCKDCGHVYEPSQRRINDSEKKS